jgi:hypothetical protein
MEQEGAPPVGDLPVKQKRRREARWARPHVAEYPRRMENVVYIFSLNNINIYFFTID